MKTIKWKTEDKTEAILISKIAKRAAIMAKKSGVHYEYITVVMDVTAVHLNGNPIDLLALSQSDDFNFGHDVFGIRRHINRNTGQLENCFSPRFSAPLPVS
jgi:hypothetical protein